MPLELGSLDSAVSSLDRAVGTTEMSSGFVGYSEDVQQTLRSGVIQNFEVAYEQCWKMMKRWLESNVSPDLDGVTRRELFRRAAEAKLIDDVEAWMSFHQTRNLTSHTYDSRTALDAFDEARAFLPLAHDLLRRLRERND